MNLLAQIPKQLKTSDASSASNASIASPKKQAQKKARNGQKTLQLVLTVT
jgi:hypothetical protein